MSKLLLDEHPLMVQKSLVKLVGLERAVIVQQIHFALSQPNAGVKLSDGHKYIWNTYEQWQEKYFDFWSTANIKKHFLKLENEGYLISIQPKIKQGNATKYYRVNLEFLEAKLQELTHQTVEYPMAYRRVSDGIPQSIPSLKGTETTTETTTERGTPPTEFESLNEGIVAETEKIIKAKLNYTAQTQIIKITQGREKEWLNMVTLRACGFENLSNQQWNSKIGYWLDDFFNRRKAERSVSAADASPVYTMDYLKQSEAAFIASLKNGEIGNA